MSEKKPAKKSTKKTATPKAAKAAKKIAPEEVPVRIDVPEEITATPDEADIMPESSVESDSVVGDTLRSAGNGRYFEAVGRRKTAIARARLFTKAGDFVVNNRPYMAYFPSPELQRISEDALKKMKLWERFRVSVKVSGGGAHSQAEATRHALARCLIKFNPDFLPNRGSVNKVTVLHTDRMRVTGRKMMQKMYRRHSGYLGNLKEERLGDLMARDSREVIRHAVAGMLPKNRLRKEFMKNLILMKGGVK